MTIKKPMRPKNAAPGPNAGMPGGATIADRFKLDAPVQKQAPKGTTAVFICALIALGVVGVLTYMLWKHWEFLMPASWGRLQ